MEMEINNSFRQASVYIIMRKSIFMNLLISHFRNVLMDVSSAHV